MNIAIEAVTCTKKIPAAGYNGTASNEFFEGIRLGNTKLSQAEFKAKVDTFIKKINDIALSQAANLLPQLLPGGKFEGDEYIALNPRRPDEHLGSFKVNWKTGVWCDFASGDKGGDFVSLCACVNHDIGQLKAAEYLADMMGVKRFNPKTPSLPANRKADSISSDRVQSIFTPVFPLPSDVLKPDQNNLDAPLFYDYKKFGKPVAVFEYTNSQGEFCFFVLRYEFINDKGKRDKSFRPLSYGNLNGKVDWHRRKPFENNLPLYNLKNLVDIPDMPVLVVEGEKAVKGAIEYLKQLEPFGYHYCVVTCSFGAGSTHKTDLSQLKGRVVKIWPDNDADGIKCAENIGDILLAGITEQVSVVPVSSLPKKWDLGDPLPENADLNSIASLFDSAQLYRPKVQFEAKLAEEQTDRMDTERNKIVSIHSKKKRKNTEPVEYLFQNERVFIESCGVITFSGQCAMKHSELKKGLSHVKGDFEEKTISSGA